MPHNVLKLSDRPWNTIAINVDDVVAVIVSNIYDEQKEQWRDDVAVTIYTDSISIHFRTSSEQADKIEQFIMPAANTLEVKPECGFSVSAASNASE